MAWFPLQVSAKGTEMVNEGRWPRHAWSSRDLKLVAKFSFLLRLLIRQEYLQVMQSLHRNFRIHRLPVKFAIVPVVIPETGYKVKQSKPTGERMKPKSSGTKSVPGGRPTRAAAHTKLPAAAEKPDEIKPETLAEPIAALRAFDANKDRIDQLKNDVLEVIDERWMEDTYKNPDLLTVTKADLVRLMKAAQPNNANVEIVADAHLRAIESARKPMVAEREALLARIAAAIATDRKDVIEAVFGIRSLGSTHAQEAAAALIPAALWAAQHGHGLTAPLLRDEPRSRFERVEQTNIALDVMFMQTRFRVSPGQGVSRRAVERANAALEIAPVSSMRNAPCLDLT